jgi:hypothetical protein
MGIRLVKRKIHSQSLLGATHMRTNLVRGFVVVLALTGFGASMIASKPVASHPSANAKVVPQGPTPLCPISDPDACGID